MQKLIEKLYLIAAVWTGMTLAAGVSDHASAQVVEGLVETRILDFDPQSGVKSQHFFFVDFASNSVEMAYSTGSTSFFGVDLGSIRDSFKVEDVNFSGNRVTFVLVGSTASGVGFVPSIDYRLKFNVAKDAKTTITGCHDGYPAYLVQINGIDVYRFQHKSVRLINLFGSCDQSVNVE